MKYGVVRARGLALSLLALLFAAGTLLSCGKKDTAIVASGTIEATDVRVSSKAVGEIIALHAAEGDSVAAGAPLAEVDRESLELQRAQAKAGVDFADAQLRLLLKGAREEDIAQASEALAQTSENLKLAKLDEARVKQLFEKGSATRKQFDDSEARLAVASAQYSAAEQGLKKLSNLARPEEVASAKAKLDQATFAYKLLDKAVRDCTVSAPSAGTVMSRLIEKGEFVSIGSPLFILADLSSMHLTIYVPETRIADVSVGQKAELRIDARKDRVFSGRVSYIASEAEFTPKNVQTADERVKQVFAVKIAVENADGVLKPGMPADARLLAK